MRYGDHQSLVIAIQYHDAVGESPKDQTHEPVFRRQTGQGHQRDDSPLQQVDRSL